MIDHQPEQWLTIREVAARLSVGVSTLYLWISKGEFPKGVKIGRNSTRWSQRSLESWMASRAQ